MRRQLATITLSRMNALLPVGFWWSEQEPHLPHPRDLVDASWDEDERRSALAYLESAYLMPYVSCGPSWSRLGCPGIPGDIGSQDLTDGTWLFPGGLAYYLRHHGVRPPEAFLAHLRASGFAMPDLPAIVPGAGEMPKVCFDLAPPREYPAPDGRGWVDGLRAILGDARRVGIEPSLRREIADELRDLSVEVAPMVEGLRTVKSSEEVAMIRRAAHYADRGVEELLAAAYRGASVAEGFARTGALSRAIVRQVADWEILTTRVLLATWAAPRSAQPHSIPALGDRLRSGPHVALALLRINGYAAESERTFFTTRPTAEMRRAYRPMLEARSIAFRMIRPGVGCA